MTILVITFSELLRAYSCRSLRASVFQLGFFSNSSMQKAVFSAIAATVFIANVPGVMDVFSLKYLQGKEWAWVICISVIPFMIDEFTKLVYRTTGFGKRPIGRAFNNELSTVIAEPVSFSSYAPLH